MINNLLATFGGVMSTIGYVLLAILILLVMITIHELGHYIAGKIFKFKIDEFAIGFGPKLFSKTKKNGEVFSLRALPLGGFCAFHGEDEDENQDKDTFNSHAPWKRIIVLISGALMNYLFALIIIVISFSVYGDVALMTYKVQDYPVGYTVENSFTDRDIILKAQGENVYLITDLMDAVQGKKAGESVQFTIYRQGEVKTLNVKLRADAQFENVEQTQALYDTLGIFYQLDANGQIGQSGLYTTGVRYGVLQTLARSVEYSFKIASTVFTVLGQLLTGSLGLSAVGGTVTTVSVTATAIKTGGIRSLLSIASFIGVNLAVFNLLPIPALDGSRVVFTAIEGIRKKPLNRKVEGIIHTVGLILLMVFAILVDLQRCF